MHSTLASGKPFPVTEIPRLGGGTMTLGKPERHDWQLIFVYRGLHCPICHQYLSDLDPKLNDFDGIEVVAVSADPEEKARKMTEEEGLTDLPIGYDLSIQQMQSLGLYISDPRNAQETDRPFAEPGLFLVNPEGNLHMIDVSNAPFLRPELDPLASRLKMVLEKDYPIRGTHSG